MIYLIFFDALHERSMISYLFINKSAKLKTFADRANTGATKVTKAKTIMFSNLRLT